MSLVEPIISIPPDWQKRYQMLRALLYAIVILTVGVFALRVLFPTLVFSFNFKTPSSSKNNILDPRSPIDTPRTNGKIEKDGALIADTGVVGNFSDAAVRVVLEKNSAVPENLAFSLRRSYRGFLLPTGTPVTGFPEATLYKVDGTYYALQNGVLSRFVSDNAYLSRYPDDFALLETEDFLKTYPVSENWIGFRVGSLVSFADGVFLIVSDTEMRPVGSADIFLAFGYRFKDVRPASEEEIGIYKRGRIFLLGAQHPDGTLLLDQDTGDYYLVEHNTKRPITDTRYLEFIKQRQTPISVSSQSSEARASCLLEPSLFGQSFSCTAALAGLRGGTGSDFEIHLEGADTDIDINTLTVSFATKKSRATMLTILSTIKQRLLSRFGIAQE